MVLKGSNVLLCALMLLTSMIFSMHAAKAAFEHPSIKDVGHSSTVLAETDFASPQSLDIDADSNENCLTHAVFMMPDEVGQDFVITSHIENTMSFEIVLSENFFNLLRPPKV